MSGTPSAAEWQAFAGKLGGPLVLPSDSAYEEKRKVWNGMIDVRPAAFASCASVDDVRRSIDFGREHGMELSIYGGGHSAAGLALTQGGLVIDLRQMNQVEVDPAAKTARAGGGATWGKFDQATTTHNLATTGGVISSTGVGGLTLGGGIGTLMRAHGLASDNVISAQVVLANGDLVTASETSNPDLFWALRGGGGNFGVVTEFTFRLHPVNGLYGGLIIHPRDAARGLIQNYRDVSATAPDDLGLFCALLYTPDGQPVAAYSTWYNGSESAAEKPMAPLKSYGTPVADLTTMTPYVAEQTAMDEGFPPGMQVYWKAHFLSGLPDDAIDVIVEHANRAPSPLSVTLLETLGGAVARHAEDATAFNHRNAPFNLAIISRWLDPADAEPNIRWGRAFFDAMQPYSSGVYVNYLGTGDDPNRVLDAYGGATMQRLRQVKRQFDPENIFHRNQNIAPG
jgi:FAD/FMN-containing dehydrogenase